MIYRPPIEVILGSVLLTYAALSLTWANTDPLYPSLYLASLAIAAWAGYRTLLLRQVWVLAMIAVAINLLSTPWLIYGFFGNPNALGCAVALGLAAALAFRHWWFIPFAAYGLAYTGSRTAMTGAAVACLCSLWRRFPLLALGAVVATIPLVLYVKDDIGNSTFVRLGIWQDTINHLTLPGRGWGAFYQDYIAFYIHTNATLLSANHVYNDGLELLFELGLFAIPAFWLFILALESSPVHRVILLTYAALSLTFFPLYLPIIGHMVIFTAANALYEREPRRLQWHAGASLPRTI